MDLKLFSKFMNNFSSKNENPPPNIYSDGELLLVQLLFNYAESINLPQDLQNYRKIIETWGVEPLSGEVISQFNENLDELFNNDIMGSWLQKSLSIEVRKSTASNYTQMISTILKSFELTDVNVIMDPFCGSGRLITYILEYINCQTVIINDISPTAVLLAYCRIRYIYPSIVITALIGDAFAKNLDNADLIIINPPFTRSMRIPSSTKQSIETKLNIKNVGHEGLHVYSVQLCDKLLNTNGRIIAVLPSSAFSSSYSKTIQSLILENYNEIKLIQESKRLSFSEDSEFNEIILSAIKQKSSGFADFENFKIDKWTIGKDELMKEWNWMKFFRNHNLLHLEIKFRDNFNLVTAKDLAIGFKRGIELYGPEFYFFPNKFHSDPILTNNVREYQDGCLIPNALLMPILRQPKLYKSQLQPKINEFTLSIPPDFTSKLNSDDLENIENYTRKHEKLSIVAKNRFGDKYLSHIFTQINTKEPVGHIFVIDKLDLFSVGSMVHYQTTPTLCTKNFYVAELNKVKSVILAAWMSSSFYLLLYLANRRELNDSYGRMQIVDYSLNQLFPRSLFQFTEDKSKRIIAEFNQLTKLKLPSLATEAGLRSRKKLDVAFVNAFNLKFDVDELYNCLNEVFTGFSRYG